MLPLPQQTENGRLSSVPAENAGARAGSCRSVGYGSRILLLTLFAQVFGLVGTASGATGAVLCLAPVVPVIDLPVEVLADYRAEISGEFEAYFAAITAYLACLDSERVRAMAEARGAAAAYSDFLNLPHIQEDIR